MMRDETMRTAGSCKLKIFIMWSAITLLHSVNARAWEPQSFQKPALAELKASLSPIAYKVTQENGTEAPFNNQYHANKDPGIYVDVVSGEPLFSSTDKFDSGTGWPSFKRPLVSENIVTKVDSTHGMKRTEIRSKYADSHLGHVFDDGPQPTGKRYCVNSASLRFIPVGHLEREGYGSFSGLFSSTMLEDKDLKSALDGGGNSVAYFAGGCFWCMEPPFEKLAGVKQVLSGYMGGLEKKPTYKDVSSGLTGHAESVAVFFNPEVISYEKLLETFWMNIDPTTDDRQFCDRGRQYRPAIFHSGPVQKEKAIKSFKLLQNSGRFEEIKVELSPAGEFTPAEDEHQDFYKKNPSRYSSYRAGCGRDIRLRTLWTGFEEIFTKL